MKDTKLAKFAKRIKEKFNKMIKTPLSEEPFGFRSLERLDIGDLVAWFELSANGREKDQKIGIIYDLYLDRRGNRDVALANVHEITNSKNNLALLGRQKEVLVVTLEVLSKVDTNNELFSI
jgi:hypothetical protein